MDLEMWSPLCSVREQTACYFLMAEMHTGLIHLDLMTAHPWHPHEFIQLGWTRRHTWWKKRWDERCMEWNIINKGSLWTSRKVARLCFNGWSAVDLFPRSESIPEIQIRLELLFLLKLLKQPNEIFLLIILILITCSVCILVIFLYDFWDLEMIALRLTGVWCRAELCVICVSDGFLWQEKRRHSLRTVAQMRAVPLLLQLPIQRQIAKWVRY